MTAFPRICFLSVVLIGCSTAIAEKAPFPRDTARSVALEELLSWLPADTETVMVANGPSAIPNEDKEWEDSTQLSDQQVADFFMRLPIASLGFKEGLLWKHLEGKRTMLSVEGSRHFRAPTSLGSMLYEGCVIAVFEDNLSDSISDFVSRSQSAAVRQEFIESHKVWIFQEMLEKDVWTVYVTFPQQNVVMVATNHEYLSEVLSRFDGKKGGRALPETLPQWNHLDKSARFWAIRHFDRSQAALDPSSPFGGKKSANFPDDGAVGIVIQSRNGNGSPEVTYLSESPQVLLTMNKVVEKMGINGIEYSAKQGAAVAKYHLPTIGDFSTFIFVFLTELGHGLYI